MAVAGKRALGFWALLALVIGNMIGSGIYLLPATLALWESGRIDQAKV